MKPSTVGMAIAVMTFAVSNTSHAQDDNGRFQVMNAAPPITVLDTATGQIWVASTHERGGTVMRQICYRGPNGHLMPTPYENKFVDDLSASDELCAPSPR